MDYRNTGLTHAEQGRRNSADYSRALRILRERHREEFEAIWTELKGEPRLRKSPLRSKKVAP